MTHPPAPKLDRSITMNWMGDWGRANLHRALGCLAFEFNKLAGPYSKVGIWTGRGALDNVQAVGRGEIDLALVVPQNFVALALDGRGLSKGEAFPNLRAIGHVPQHDRMIMAVRSDLGITSYDDIRKKKPKLRITTGPDDGVDLSRLRRAVDHVGGRHSARRVRSVGRIVHRIRRAAHVHAPRARGKVRRDHPGSGDDLLLDGARG